MKFQKLLSDHILVELEPEKRVTSAGIIVPESTSEPLRIGRVKQVGPGRRYTDCYRPTEAKVGDRVAFFIASTDTKGGRQVTYYLEENERVIRENDVLFTVADGVEVELTV